jgi:transporter family protein
VHWLTYTLLSTLLYGLWGFFSKLATKYIDPNSVLVYQALGAMLVEFAFIASSGWKWQVNIQGILYGILVGITGIVATLFFFFALSKNSASVVLPLTSLYPLVTVILAFLILKEPITLKQSIGILLAIVALVLCSWDG